MQNQGKITFQKESKIRKILTADIGKLWLAILLIIGIIVLVSTGEDNFFQAITGIGIIVVSLLAIIFGR